MPPLVTFDVVTSEDHLTRTVLWERRQYADTEAWHEGVSVVKASSGNRTGSTTTRTTPFNATGTSESTPRLVAPAR